MKDAHEILKIMEQRCKEGLPYEQDSPDIDKVFHAIAVALTDLIVTEANADRPDPVRERIIWKVRKLICSPYGHGVVQTDTCDGDRPEHKRIALVTQRHYLGGCNYETWHFDVFDEDVEPGWTIFATGQLERKPSDKIEWVHDDFDDRTFPTGGDGRLKTIANEYQEKAVEIVTTVLDELGITDTLDSLIRSYSGKK